MNRPSRFFAALVERRLQEQWAGVLPVQVVVDLPALHALHWLEPIRVLRPPVLVVTENPCPCYHEHLVERGASLIACPDRVEDVLGVLERVAAGEVVTNVTAFAGSLTNTERVVLRLVAQGVPNKVIGTFNGTTEGTVKGQIRSVLAKLTLQHPTFVLRDRLDLMRYYRGEWDALELGGAVSISRVEPSSESS